MIKVLNITIPTPCREKWEAMTPEDKGRFCASCHKKVYDFTRSSDREIASVLSKETTACGRFLSTQLNRNLVVTKEKSTAWMAASAAVMSFLTLGANEAMAQIPVPTEQGENNKSAVLLDDVAVAPVITIKGTVYDEEHLPLPGAHILVKGTSKEVETDIDGKFNIEASSGDVLQFTFIGFETKSVVVEDHNSLNIMLVSMEMSSIGVIVYKRTFFGRIFHSIGNLFR